MVQTYTPQSVLTNFTYISTYNITLKLPVLSYL